MDGDLLRSMKFWSMMGMRMSGHETGDTGETMFSDSGVAVAMDMSLGGLGLSRRIRGLSRGRGHRGNVTVGEFHHTSTRDAGHLHRTGRTEGHGGRASRHGRVCRAGGGHDANVSVADRQLRRRGNGKLGGALDGLPSIGSSLLGVSVSVGNRRCRRESPDSCCSGVGATVSESRARLSLARLVSLNNDGGCGLSSALWADSRLEQEQPLADPSGWSARWRQRDSTCAAVGATWRATWGRQVAQACASTASS